MKQIELSAAMAALLFTAGILGAGGASAANDDKNWAGYSCIPQISQEQDFIYQVGGLTNKSFKPRVVFCPLTRDNARSTASAALQDLELRAVRPGSATTPLKCTLRFRSKIGGVLFAQTKSSTAHGNVTLDFDPDLYTVSGGRSRGTWDLQCIISERSTIRNYRITEETPTDSDAGI